MLKKEKKKIAENFQCFRRQPIEQTRTKIGKMFYYILSTFMKNVFSNISRLFEQNYVGFVKKKVICKSRAFKYQRYKSDFLDENSKTRFSDMKKLQEATKI